MSNPLVGPPLASLVGGRLLERAGTLPDGGLCLTALLCDWDRAFIAKGTVGRHYRAVSRNGRVLLASDRPLEESAGRLVRLRIAHWHRQILPGELPSPWGIVLAAWTLHELPDGHSPCSIVYKASIFRDPAPDAGLSIGLGGLRVLSLCAETTEIAD